MKLMASMMVSVDGVYQGPGGPDEDRRNGFDRGGWTAAHADEEMWPYLVSMFERADALLAAMEPDEAEEVRELLAYPEDTAGGIMTNECVTVPPDITAQEAIAHLRREAEAIDEVASGGCRSAPRKRTKSARSCSVTAPGPSKPWAASQSA